MKRLTSLCAVLALGAGLLCAAPPSQQRALPTHSPQRQLIRGAASGRYVAPSPATRTAPVPGIHSARHTGHMPLSPVRAKAPARVGESGSTVYASIAVAPDLPEPRNVAEVFLDGRITTLPVEFPAGPHNGPMKITGLYMRGGKFHLLRRRDLHGPVHLRLVPLRDSARRHRGRFAYIRQ